MVPSLTSTGHLWGRADLRAAADRPVNVLPAQGPAGGPTVRSARAQRDDELRVEIQRVWDANQQVYGARKVWRQLRREQISVARCSVRRLMRALGLVGTGRSQAWVITTHADPAGSRRLISWSGSLRRRAKCALGLGLHVRGDVGGFVYVAFVIDVFARRIVGWRVSASLARTSCSMRSSRRSTTAAAGGLGVDSSQRPRQTISLDGATRVVWPMPTSPRPWSAVVILTTMPSANR